MSFLRDLVEKLEWFGDSYLATLAIGLVVSYLGVYVVLKRIVFLGITLAQAAAAGIAVVFFAQGHVTPGGWLDGWLEEYGPTTGALAVSTAGVAAFALPGEPKRLSREALLGMGYAFFAGVSILLVWWSPKGADELKNLLSGDVLFAKDHIRALLVGLGSVTVLHALFRKEFLLTSYDPDFARTARLPVKVYDVLLALSLGVAVSLALKVAGILLVFAFLAVSPAAGLTLGRKLSHAKAIALAVAAGSSLLGWVVAIREDLPVSPTVACFLVAHAGLAAAIARLRWPAIERVFHVGVTALAFVALATGAHVAVRHETTPLPREPVTAEAKAGARAAELVAAYRSASAPDAVGKAAVDILKKNEPALLVEFVQIALGRDEDARNATFDALGAAVDVGRIAMILEPYLQSPNRATRVSAALGLIRLGDGRGVTALLETIASKEAQPGTREEAVMELLRLYPLGDAFGYDPFKGAGENARAVNAWSDWWKSQGRLQARKP